MQMHPRYQEFLAVMVDCPHRKTPECMQTAFWAWLNFKDTSESLAKGLKFKAEQLESLKDEKSKCDEKIDALKRDLNIKHRECAELQKQLSIQAEYISEIETKIETRKEYTFFDARIEALLDVFMLASLVQFKYVQTIGEPNENNFRVGLAGGYEVFGSPEQYNAFIDKYLTWLESR